MLDRRLFFEVFCNQDRIRLQNSRFRKNLEQRFQRKRIGRIEKNYIKLLGRFLEKALSLRCNDLCPLGKPGLFQILFNDFQRVPRIVDEHDSSCSPAERLDADSADACEQVEEERSLHFLSENIEQRLLYFVGCRPDTRPCGHFQLSAFAYASRNSHALCFFDATEKALLSQAILDSQQHCVYTFHIRETHNAQ